jgi:aminoglycoside phosphotransferase (APT) family kinase protein
MDDDLARRLLCVLRAKTGVATLAYTATPERLRGGFWADLLAFSLVDAPPGLDGELVARVMPDSTLAAKEVVVQTAAADAGVPTPAVRCSGGPEDGLGRAYVVMDRADGVPLLAGLDKIGAIIGAPRRLARMPEVLAAVMARLHAVDAAVVRDPLSQLDGVATTVPEMVEGLGAWAEQLGRTDLTQAARWLLAHPTPAAPLVICHGDLHPFNVLVDERGRVTLLDWTVSILGPRSYDVAFTSLVLANPPVIMPAPLRPVASTIGRALAARFVRRYRHHTGCTFDRADIAWYQAVVALRALAEVAQWVEDGVIDGRAGHPWLLCGEVFAGHLRAVTGAPVRSR